MTDISLTDAFGFSEGVSVPTRNVVFGDAFRMSDKIHVAKVGAVQDDMPITVTVRNPFVSVDLSSDGTPLVS